jgi:hypothetical protein
MELLDLQLGLQIDLVVMLGPQTVTRFLPVLAHHDDRGLDG